MTTQISTQTISFYGSDLITLKVEDVIYTAVRPIAEALGLSWSTQKRKLDNSMSKFNCVHMNTVAEDGKFRQMLCMPLKKLNGWLFSINPEKVRADLREKVIQYQEECFEALYNYWFNGKAERQASLPLAKPTKDTMSVDVNVFHHLLHLARTASDTCEELMQKQIRILDTFDLTLMPRNRLTLNYELVKEMQFAIDDAEKVARQHIRNRF